MEELRTDVVYAHLPDDLTGLYDHETRTIYLDRRCHEHTLRCTLEHELVHAERGDCHIGIPHLDAKQEETVERIAARRLLPVEKIKDALPWAVSFATLAHTLEVDHDILRTRLTHLSEHEWWELSEWLVRYEEVA